MLAVEPRNATNEESALSASKTAVITKVDIIRKEWKGHILFYIDKNERNEKGKRKVVIKVYIEDIEEKVILEIINPKPGTLMRLSDMAFGLSIIARWGKDTSFLLRENMKIKNT